MHYKEDVAEPHLLFFIGDVMKTSIIPIFIPHIGCPYRCIFCNQWKITGHQGVPTGNMVAKEIDTYISSAKEPRHWEVAFYGGSFTAIAAALQEELLQPAYEALQNGKIAAIRCSTRPDCITPAILDRLTAYGMTIVELGVQSMDDNVLQTAKRGHTAADVVQATALLRARKFIVGHQLMPGLPGEDIQSLRKTTAAICQLKPDIARIYPVAVIDKTELAQMYRQGTYTPLSVHEGVQRGAYMKQAFVKAGIRVIRTGLQATRELDDAAQVLGGAYTPAMGELIDTKRYQTQIFAVLDMIQAASVQVFYHRKDTSRVRGYHNVTVKRARLRYPFAVTWQEDNSLPVGTVAVVVGQKVYNIYIDKERIKVV